MFVILKFHFNSARLGKLHVTMDTNQLDTFYDYESRLLSKHVRINVLNNIFCLVECFLTIFTLKLVSEGALFAQNAREKKLLPNSISATCDLRAHLKSISVFHMQYFFQSYCAWFFSACFKNEEKPDGIWFIFCQQYGW